ncbi:hypothetical protein Tco_0312267 [Tanacetum coccineum]
MESRLSRMFETTRNMNQMDFVGDSWSDSGEEDKERNKDETCLMSQASNELCLGIDLELDKWIKDSGCTKNMTGNRNLFSSYKVHNGDPDPDLRILRFYDTTKQK